MAYYESQGNRIQMQHNSSAAPKDVPPMVSYPPEVNAQIDMEHNMGKKISIFKVIGLVFLGFVLLGAVILSNVQQLQISNQITESITFGVLIQLNLCLIQGNRNLTSGEGVGLCLGVGEVCQSAAGDRNGDHSNAQAQGNDFLFHNVLFLSLCR